MAVKKGNKQKAKELIIFGVIGYIICFYFVCHFSQLEGVTADNISVLLMEHVTEHPFDIFPINWEHITVLTFCAFLCAGMMNVSYEKQKDVRNDIAGSAKWNDNYGKFAAKYAEPFGKKNIEQKTGWLDKKTGKPWAGEKNKNILANKPEEKTKSFVVAIKNLIKAKIKILVLNIKDKWLNFTSKFHKDTVVSGEEELKAPTPSQRKIFDKICEFETKLDMDLNRYKPKACVEELKKAKELEERRAGADKLIKKNTLQNAPIEKMTASLIPANRNMILSQNVALSMDGRKTRKNCNTLILGGSGAGKTRFYLKPNLMQLNCSYVITDPSGEILETMGHFLQNAGYEIKVINLTEMDHSNCYNPFNYVREDADILVMIDVLTKNLTPPDSHSSDPFWPKSQAALLQAIAFYLYKECRPSERNFTNVMKLLRAAIIKEGNDDSKSPLDIIFEDLEKKDPNHIAVMQYSIFKQAPAKTASTILTCAQVDLAPFNLETIANLTSIDTVDMSTIGLKPTALFCITPTAKTTYNWIISLAYTQLFETLYYTAETKCKGKRLPVHVRFLLDEFANIGQIPDFEQKLSTMRKYEISCAIIIQNMAQLETMYKDAWKTIVGNCDEFIYLGGHESSSTEYVSKMLGKQTAKSRNSSRTYGRQGSNNISLNATGRELMTPDEIAHMSDQDCLVMVKGVMPFFDNKYDLLKHPNYKHTGDASDDLLFDIAAEIQTPDHKALSGGGNSESKRRTLNRQAQNDARLNRNPPINVTGARHKDPTAITPENLAAAGFNKDFSNALVTSVNIAGNEFDMDEEFESLNDENFDNFLDEDNGAVSNIGNSFDTVSDNNYDEATVSVNEYDDEDVVPVNSAEEVNEGDFYDSEMYPGEYDDINDFDVDDEYGENEYFSVDEDDDTDEDESSEDEDEDVFIDNGFEDEVNYDFIDTPEDEDGEDDTVLYEDEDSSDDLPPEYE